MRCVWLLTCTWGLATTAAAQDHSEHAHAPAQTGASTSRHVPPDPPSHAMRDMSEREMIELMDMDDNAAFIMVRADSFEWQLAEDDDAFAWDLQGWYGNDRDKLVLKTEGEFVDSDVDSRNEVLWDRVLSRWWNLQAGVRHDVHPGPSRSWAAVGVQGLAPYWFEVEATAYIGEEGRTALRIAVDYELLITQRLVLEPEVELQMFGKSDAENRIGSGVSSSEIALRLRYEFRREFAPYIGVSWTRLYGNTATINAAMGNERSEIAGVLGARWWF
jgi:copper resistance protein B